MQLPLQPSCPWPAKLVHIIASHLVHHQQHHQFWLGWLLHFLDRLSFRSLRPCSDRQKRGADRRQCEYFANSRSRFLPQLHLHLLVQFRESLARCLISGVNLLSCTLKHFRFSRLVLALRKHDRRRKISVDVHAPNRPHPPPPPPPHPPQNAR